MRDNSGIDVIFQSKITHKTLVIFYAPLYQDGEIIGEEFETAFSVRQSIECT